MGVFCTEEFGRIKKMFNDFINLWAQVLSTERRVKGMCVFVCECASCCASIFCLQGVFMNTSPLWNVIYIFPVERMLMRAWAVKTFCQRLHLFPTLDGCVSKHSFILFSAWHMHMHVFSLTDLFWVHYFSFFFMRSSILYQYCRVKVPCGDCCTWNSWSGRLSFTHIIWKTGECLWHFILLPSIFCLPSKVKQTSDCFCAEYSSPQQINY